MRTASADGFAVGLDALAKVLRPAIKNGASLATHSFYSPKARAALATLRKHFLMLVRDYPEERYPGIAFQLTTIDPLVSRIIELFPTEPKEMLRLLREVQFIVDSDLAAELDAPAAIASLSPAVPFVPGDLVPNRLGVFAKVLWEANRCYDAACYNACAALMRRLCESLIVEGFERLGIGDRIRNKGGDYLAFGDLVGKAVAEPAFGLTKNTKRILPEVKFLGDLGAHNRLALVRKPDLDRIRNALRVGVEELVRKL